MVDSSAPSERLAVHQSKEPPERGGSDGSRCPEVDVRERVRRPGYFFGAEAGFTIPPALATWPLVAWADLDSSSSM